MHIKNSHVQRRHKHNQNFGTSTKATKTLWSKENHTENSKRENAKEKAEYVKTEQSVKTNFFEARPWLKSINFEITKVAYTSEDHAKTISDPYNCFPNYSN